MKIDISNVPVEQLLKELENRKKEIVPKIVEEMNNNLKTLETLGVKIYDINDDDIRMTNIQISNEGKLVFNCIERWDD